MNDETFVTGRWNGLSGEPGIPSSESNDSAVNDSVSIHSLLTQASILNQCWASVSRGVARGLMELRSLYEDLRRQTRSETLPGTACGETPQPRLRQPSASCALNFPRIPPFTSRVIPATHLEI